MANQAVVTTIADIKVKFGKSDKGPWALATIVGSDNKKYKTFDEAITVKAKEAMSSSSTVEILYISTQKSFKNDKGEQVPYEDREIKDLVIKTGGAAPSAQPGASVAPAADQQRSEYSEQRDRQEFQRQASQTAIKVCSDIMASCLASQVENYKFDDAMRIIKHEAKSLYATYFKPLEGGSHENADSAEAGQEAEIVE